MLSLCVLSHEYLTVRKHAFAFYLFPQLLGYVCLCVGVCVSVCG